jgi:superfamily II DNA or RNA helicase/sugar phosphate isomerase/epimerase
MPTLIECLSLEQSLSLCSELELDFVEMNMNLPEFQLDRIDVDNAKRLFQHYGKYPTIHLDENLNVCDFNTAVADAYLNTVLSTISLAKELYAPIINMHMSEGVHFTLPDRKVYLFEQYKTQFFDRLRQFRDVCTAKIADDSILICVENCGKYHDFQQAGIDVLLESPSFALTYDVGHDFCVGNGNKKFFISRADSLKHMHLHDATGTRNHLPLGTGDINIAEMAALAAKHNCRCVLETKTADALRQSAEYLRRVTNTSQASATPDMTNQMTPDMLCPIITNDSTNDDKLDLFASLFKGRDDVYARRWESRDGQKYGYVPACRNEWKRGLCEKPRVKCADCKNRVLIPPDKNILARHLAGKEVVGVYPLLPDENCLFLAMDFDDGDWSKDVTALRQICKENDIPIAVERSRSGSGAHVRFFFDNPVSANIARKFGSALLTAAMEQWHSLKFTSYDRLFPNQDTMPKGGFGNLIALPLQREARNNDNSVFIDEQCIPYADQWAFLSALRRLGAGELESLSATLSKDGELGTLRNESDEENEKPWQKKPTAKLCAADSPAETRIVEANMLYIDKSGFSARALNRLKRLAAFKNAEFYKAQAMRLSTWNKPRIIGTSNETEKYLCLPRGCKDDVKTLLDSTPIQWQDERNTGINIDVTFNGVLREEQVKATAALLSQDNGILSATTAFGKTVVGAALIAERKVNTLVLVNRRPLLDQWKTRLTAFLSINETLPELPAKRGRKKQRNIIGLLGGGKNSLGGIIDVAIIQSLVHGDEVKDTVKNYGMVIVDECHHVSAFSFERVLKEVNARYVYGLTATPKRQDGHQPIITMQCGEIRYKDDAKLQAKNRPFEHYIIPRFTSYRLPIDKDGMQIQDIFADICQNERRNDMIVADVLQAVSEGRDALILTERKTHVEILEKALREKASNVIALTGGQPSKERKRLLEQITAVPEEQPLVIVATGKYVGEGFDAPRLDTLFLAMPISWQGTLAQYAGRLHRLHDGKDEVRIYDYIDVHVAMLERMYAKRVKGYAAIGYSAKCEGVAPPEGNIIFDSSSFLPVFTADLLAAKREIVIVSPFLTQSRVNKMMNTLESCVVSGALVTAVTRPVSDYAEKDAGRVSGIIKFFTDNGIAVVGKSKIHQKFAVIDGRIVWYGSINLLSFGSAEESIMRLDSVGIADELMGVVRDK